MKNICICFEKKDENSVITLQELTAQAEEQTRENISAGNFESFADFLSYYRHHYAPVLKQVRNGDTPTKDGARVLRFLASDLLEMFGEDDDE